MPLQWQHVGSRRWRWLRPRNIDAVLENLTEDGLGPAWTVDGSLRVSDCDLRDS
eukprot:SAG11_NODE_329_length_10681_cov_7.861274_7_plen_54_part_00